MEVNSLMTTQSALKPFGSTRSMRKNRIRQQLGIEKNNSLKISNGVKDNDKIDENNDENKSATVKNKSFDNPINKQIEIEKANLRKVREWATERKIEAGSDKDKLNSISEMEQSRIKIIESKIKALEEQKIQLEIEEMQRQITERLEELEKSTEKEKDKSNKSETEKETRDKKNTKMMSKLSIDNEKISSYKQSALSKQTELTRLKIEATSENNFTSTDSRYVESNGVFIGRFKREQMQQLGGAIESIRNSISRTVVSMNNTVEEWTEDMIEIEQNEDIENDNIIDEENENVEENDLNETEENDDKSNNSSKPENNKLDKK